MESIFDRIFKRGLDRLVEVHGVTVNVYRATGGQDGNPESFLAIFNEQVGAVDEIGRTVFTFRLADAATPALDRGDWFVLPGETERWYIVNYRDDKSGGIEVRCDRKLVRL